MVLLLSEKIRTGVSGLFVISAFFACQLGKKSMLVSWNILFSSKTENSHI